MISKCVWQFKSRGCAYKGPLTSCDHTPIACLERNNLVHFGGFETHTIDMVIDHQARVTYGGTLRIGKGSLPKRSSSRKPLMTRIVQCAESLSGITYVCRMKLFATEDKPMWTKQAPTEPGFYWWKHTEDGQIVPEVIELDRGVWLRMDYEGGFFAEICGEFWPERLRPPV